MFEIAIALTTIAPTIQAIAQHSDVRGEYTLCKRSTMQDLRTRVALWIAQTINPPVQPKRHIKVNLNALRQLPEGTLGREVARFLDDNQFTLFESGDLIHRTHDIWHVVTGLSASEHDELMLQAFTRAQVFRPSSAVFVLYGLAVGKLRVADLLQGIQRGRLAQRLVQWDIESDWAIPLTEVRRKLGVTPFNQNLPQEIKLK